jgi:peptide chain release factor subunit 1
MTDGRAPDAVAAPRYTASSDLEERNAFVDVTAADIRKLVNRPVTEEPVTTVYLNTDGARFPKTGDYEARLDGLLRDVRKTADTLPERRRSAALADAQAISSWVRNDFERDQVRGVGVFASGGAVFDTVQSGIGVRNIARVNERPYVVPLEALLGRHHHIALVIVERDKARIFRYQLGRCREWLGIAADVHGQHKQGGWSQKGFEKGIEHEVALHYKDTVEVLRLLHAEQPIDALVLAGPPAEAAEFSKKLHPYLQQVVHGEPLSLPGHSSADDVCTHLVEVEQALVSGRRSALLRRLAAAQGQGAKAARGLRHVVEAVNGKRVEVLFVVEGAGQPGYRSSSGALALHDQEAAAYGEPVEVVDDLIDEVIEEAVRSNAHIELFRDPVRLDGHPVAALLRF